MLEGGAEKSDFKKSMIRRLIIAVVLVILLIVGLIFIERIQTPKTRSAPPATATEPAPEVASPTETPAPIEEEATEPEQQEQQAEPIAEEPPPPPIVVNTRPQTEADAIRREPPKSSIKAPEARLTLGQELPKAKTPPKSFVLQLGVFSSTANAEELREKLEKHGIKAYTETRVQLGPFKTRAEADSAREKLRALGISSVVVPGK